jgi:predicted heme/steroid binding protein
MGKNMRFLILLYILVLCTACGPLGLPAAEPSPTRIGTETSPTASETAPVVLPTETSTPALPSPTPMFEGMIDNVVIDRQGQVYASGYGPSWDGSKHFALWDGAKWIALGTGVEAAGGNALVTDSANQLYTAIITAPEQGFATAIVRWDGAGWEEITGNFSTVVDALKAGRISSNIPLAALAFDGEDHLYAAGSFQYPSADHTREWSMGYVAKLEKETWTVLGPGFDQVYILDMAVSAAGKVYVAGEQPRIPAGEYDGPAGFIAEWDGETWTEIDTSLLNPCWNIRNLALDKAGGLYATCVRGEGGELIFYWDGTDWTTITDQLQGEAPAVYDLAVDENGHLYIGGSFESVSGIPARNIAYWDGDVWHALGEGVKGQVYALAFDPGGELYAAGLLMEAGGQYAGLAARWDGETWHALGP